MKTISILTLLLFLIGKAYAAPVVDDELRVDIKQMNGQLMLTLHNVGGSPAGIVINKQRLLIKPNKTVTIPFPQGQMADAKIYRKLNGQFRMLYAGRWAGRVGKFVIPRKKK